METISEQLGSWSSQTSKHKKKQIAQVQSLKREEQKAKLIASNIYTLLSSLNVPSMTHPLTDQ